MFLFLCFGVVEPFGEVFDTFWNFVCFDVGGIERFTVDFHRFLVFRMILVNHYFQEMRISRVSVRSSRVLSIFGLPVPRHAFTDAVDLVIWQALQHRCEPGLGIDFVDLCGLNERVGDCSGFACAC